jgi:hypothetical protein
MSDEAQPPPLPATRHALRRRVALLGVPRSGTTWLANVLSAHPSVRLVNEPENRLLDVLGWLGTGRLGVVPALAPGDSAREYRTMWAVALAGGWPEEGAGARASALLRRVAVREALPRRVRGLALRGAGELAARHRQAVPVVLVKSVRTGFTLDWVAAEFDPSLLVVWRHPLNVVSSWLHQEWGTSRLNEPLQLRERFADTALWPPPTDHVAATAWTVCAHLTILLESVARHPEALVVNHEHTALDPERATGAVLDWIGLDTTAAVSTFIAENDRPGEGFAIQRRAHAEPAVWRARLDGDDQREVATMVDRFENESAVAARWWPTSPAVAP